MKSFSPIVLMNFFDKFFPTNFFLMIIFCFQKVELPAFSSTEHSHIAHQIRVAPQTESSSDVKIGNLQGLKADSDALWIITV